MCNRGFPWLRSPKYGLNVIIPWPEDRVSLRRARIEFENDALLGDALMEDMASLDIEVVSFLARNSAEWVRFWAVHDPDPLQRLLLRRQVERDEAGARAILSQIERLREQDYDPKAAKVLQ
jgi:hypothetical protein